MMTLLQIVCIPPIVTLQVLSSAFSIPKAVYATSQYFATLLYLLLINGRIDGCPFLKHNTAQLVHVYSLARTIKLFDLPHYRAKTFQEDLRNNLKNVAIPGTGDCC